VYRYDERIQQTTGDKLDTRNDGGCIFVAPSVARDKEGCEVAGYVWIREPGPSEELAVLPDAAVQRNIHPRKIFGLRVPENTSLLSERNILLFNN
jgi:hypothetical protein